MLSSLTVKNYILIDDLCLDFESGFSAFTGETGAGKSILIDAINILGGDKFTTDLIRQGTDKSYLEALFITKHPRVSSILNEYGIESEEGRLIISRELSRDGKSNSRINGKSVPVSVLRLIANELIDIHSQHDTQYLLNSKTHLSLLDAYHPSKHIESVESAWKAYKNVWDDLEEKKRSSLNPDELDYLKFQLQELQDAHVVLGEDLELESKLKAIMAFEKNSNRLELAVQSLDQGDSVPLRLHEAMKQLQGIEGITQLEPLLASIQSHYYDLQDHISELKRIQSSFSYDEYELNQIQERLFILGKLKKKFGSSLERVLEQQSQIEERIQLIEIRFEVLDALQRQKESLYASFLDLAHQLSQERKLQAKSLEKAVLEHCKDLYLEKAAFEISFKEHEGNSRGIDEVEFLISMNPGEPLRPLVKVASGGELSRLMLGLKVVFNQLQAIETVIFDEIDAGVSGRVASSIGLKMKQLAQHAQVFSVTHLAQVAAYAKQHYYVHKLQMDHQTTTQIKRLIDQERKEALSLILSGTVSEASLEASQELLDHAQSTL